MRGTKEAVLLDDPESLLSGPQIGIADIFMHS